jgi:threonine synthase
MEYVSTRGGMMPKPFSDILIVGLAPDGGLIIPESFPSLDARVLIAWRKLY